MTVIESFLAFTARLGDSDRQSVEEALADLMESYNSNYGFSTTDLAELQQRVREPAPAIASDDEVRRVFGHTFDRK